MKLSVFRILRAFCLRRARLAGLIIAGERGLVFMAPHPEEVAAADGFGQRVRAMDNFFKDRPRWYVRVVDRGKGRIVRYGPDSVSIRLPFWHLPLLLAVLGLVLHNKLLYVHSIVNCARGADTLLQYVPGVFRILDLHGLAPEELSHVGARFPIPWWAGRVERLVVRRAHCLIAVTATMLEHIMGKYPGLGCRKIVLPIFPAAPAQPAAEADLDKFFEPEFMNLPGVIYAGGLQAWQQLPRMFSAVAAQPSLARYLILTPAAPPLPAELSALFARHGNVKFGQAAPERMPALYRNFQYGFVLREASLINQAACPTKLIEYLEHGLVPIMLSPAIGDFAGLSFLPLAEFEQGRLMAPRELAEAAAVNRRVLQKIYAWRDKGLETLRRVVAGRLEAALEA